MQIYIKMIEAKGCGAFMGVLRIERLRANTFHKALIRSVMSYTCTAWEFAAGTNILKMQSPKNKVLRTFGNFPRRTATRELHGAFEIPFVYERIAKLSRSYAK